VVRRYLNPCALLLIAATAVIAQSPALDAGKGAAQKDCGSVVIIKCDAPAANTNTDAAEQAQQSRRTEPRRTSPLVQQLDGVVIEGELLRRRSIEETMASAFPTVLPRDGNYTFDKGEGSKCTCMNVCPPWPLPCCTCSGQLSRYRAMPGSSPLN
jgi:hypothetical protein